eukprot:144823_1
MSFNSISNHEWYHSSVNQDITARPPLPSEQNPPYPNSNPNFTQIPLFNLFPNSLNLLQSAPSIQEEPNQHQIACPANDEPSDRQIQDAINCMNIYPYCCA